ncbi:MULTISPECIES: LysR family transcriptional regulator [unclassified Massilia]|uniref:LysR family transcriptional regulator n=1 Tax=unclassified Massilia TaxID=2609279 RepID=UPI001E64659C|nr:MULTISPECIES: LysR family transcriptional regulator [unclassified Massilia]
MVTFLVLMRERSVSAAAHKLFLGQPAVSGALARLRQLFGDELLVRGTRGMEPTPRALDLAAAIEPAVALLQKAIAVPPAFDPASSERLFVVGMPDWVEHWLMPGLLTRVRRLAPRVRIVLKESNPFAVGDMLDKDEIELGVAALRTGPRWQHQRPLREMGFRCVYDPRQLPFAGAVTLAQYVAVPHLLVSYRGAVEGTADAVLAGLGLRRDVCYTTPRFSAVPGVLGANAIVSTVPEVLADRWAAAGLLASSALPIAMDRFTVSMAWHARRDDDAALHWLMGVIEDEARAAP